VRFLFPFCEQGGIVSDGFFVFLVSVCCLLPVWTYMLESGYAAEDLNLGRQKTACTKLL